MAIVFHFSFLKRPCKSFSKPFFFRFNLVPQESKTRVVSETKVISGKIPLFFIANLELSPKSFTFNPIITFEYKI